MRRFVYAFWDNGTPHNRYILQTAQHQAWQHLDVCAKLILAAEKTDITCAAFGTSRDSWLLAGDEDTDSSFGGFRVKYGTGIPSELRQWIHDEKNQLKRDRGLTVVFGADDSYVAWDSKSVKWSNIPVELERSLEERCNQKGGWLNGPPRTVALGGNGVYFAEFNTGGPLIPKGWDTGLGCLLGEKYLPYNSSPIEHIALHPFDHTKFFLIREDGTIDYDLPDSCMTPAFSMAIASIETAGRKEDRQRRTATRKGEQMLKIMEVEFSEKEKILEWRVRALEKREGAIKMWKEVTKRREEGLRTKVEAIRNREEGLKTKEEATRKREDTLAAREEAARRREEALTIKEEERRKKERVLERRRQSMDRREDAITEREEELRKQEEAMKQKEEEGTMRKKEGSQRNEIAEVFFRLKGVYDHRIFGLLSTTAKEEDRKKKERVLERRQAIEMREEEIKQKGAELRRHEEVTKQRAEEVIPRSREGTPRSRDGIQMNEITELFFQWKKEYDHRFFGQVPITAFPSLPRKVCICNEASCLAYKREEGSLMACRHDLERLLRASGHYSVDWLRRESFRWHPDRFGMKCDPAFRAGLSKKATKMFLMFREIIKAEQERQNSIQ